MSTPSDPLTKAEREALRTSFLTDEWESDLFAVVEGIIAAHDAQIRADERQRVAALLADETAVEKVAEALAPGPWWRHVHIARAALAAIAGLLDEEAGK